MRRNLALSLCAGLLVLGVSNRPAAAQTPDRDFLTEVAQSNVAEIQAAELALERSRNVAVKRLAHMIIEDHKMAQDQVSALTATTTVTLPTTPDTMSQEAYDELEDLNGEVFDRAYIKHQIEAHKKAIWALERQMWDSSDSQFKTFARTILPSLRRHLEEFKYLKAQCHTWSPWNL